MLHDATRLGETKRARQGCLVSYSEYPALMEKVLATAAQATRRVHGDAPYKSCRNHACGHDGNAKQHWKLVDNVDSVERVDSTIER